MAQANLKVSFPQGKIYAMQNAKGNEIIDSAYIEWNPNYNRKLNSNLNQTQVFLDNTVIGRLGAYVSRKTGVQELSIRLRSVPGSGEVWIAVPYARYQAYSSRIKKMSGKRGKEPFERMVKSEGNSILNQVSAYSRRLNS